MDDPLFEELMAVEEQLLGKDGMGEPEAPSSPAPLVRALNVVLANQVSIYHEAHGFHWNVKGSDFAQYHELFSGIYEDAISAVDPTAEMILKLGFDSPFHMSDFMKLRTIGEAEPQDNPQAMAMALLQMINAFIKNLEDAFDVASDDSVDEQGVANFLAERIDANQKTAWQLRASLNLQMPNRLF